MTDSSQLPGAAWLVALTSLPGMGPARLQVVCADRSAEEAWQHVLDGATGVPDAVALRWRSTARGLDVAGLWTRHETAGVRVMTPESAEWPLALLDDPEPPALLFVRGDLAALERPRAALIGTRRCSQSGRAVAGELGRDLADAGVCVLSGLALGIDGAAHVGALAADGAPPVAVVGSGLDVVYPPAHRQLWDEVAGRGALLSEYPLGTPPDRWRFPARNRLLAALADVIVVVESHVRGGSLYTVEAGLERDRTVLAVPGSVRSPAAAGTNALLAAGSAPARDATDVLVALGLDSEAMGRAAGGGAAGGAPPTADEARVLDAVGWEPATLEQVAERLGVPLGPVAVHLHSLEVDGWVVQQAGWYERIR